MSPRRQRPRARPRPAAGRRHAHLIWFRMLTKRMSLCRNTCVSSTCASPTAERFGAGSRRLFACKAWHRCPLRPAPLEASSQAHAAHLVQPAALPGGRLEGKTAVQEGVGRRVRLPARRDRRQPAAPRRHACQHMRCALRGVCARLGGRMGDQVPHHHDRYARQHSRGYAQIQGTTRPQLR